jgi:hypothetical protein
VRFLDGPVVGDDVLEGVVAVSVLARDDDLGRRLGAIECRLHLRELVVGGHQHRRLRVVEEVGDLAGPLRQRRGDVHRADLPEAVLGDEGVGRLAEPPQNAVARLDAQRLEGGGEPVGSLVHRRVRRRLAGVVIHDQRPVSPAVLLDGRLQNRRRHVEPVGVVREVDPLVGEHVRGARRR